MVAAAADAAVVPLLHSPISTYITVSQIEREGKDYLIVWATAIEYVVGSTPELVDPTHNKTAAKLLADWLQRDCSRWSSLTDWLTLAN